jgi:undecaprenyl-diphosphatase
VVSAAVSTGRTRDGLVRAGLVCAGLVAAFGVLTGIEASTSLLAGPDSTVLGWMLDHRTGAVTALARAVTASGDSPVLFPLVALAALLVAGRTRRWQPGVAALAVVAGGMWVRLVVSRLVRDARPPPADRLVVAHGFSFPSGHAATSALVAGALAWLLGGLLVSRRLRLTVAGCLGAWAVAVALSRLYLGVHWISDVVGSWLLAGAFLGVLRSVSTGRAGPPPAPPDHTADPG